MRNVQSPELKRNVQSQQGWWKMFQMSSVRNVSAGPKLEKPACPLDFNWSSLATLYSPQKYFKECLFKEYNVFNSIWKCQRYVLQSSDCQLHKKEWVVILCSAPMNCTAEQSGLSQSKTCCNEDSSYHLKWFIWLWGRILSSFCLLWLIIRFWDEAFLQKSVRLIVSNDSPPLYPTPG